MIPIRLTLHNFISHLDPGPLNFQAFDLAILSGVNGVGKSSLLEAITWCLWEQARASSDELIHQGANSMWVEFIFEHEQGIYRVLRKRDRSRKTGHSTLEFQVKSAKGDVELAQWQSLTEGTIRQTQEKITSHLRLTYDLFVNSSYLRQGHADEFTVKPPSQRKEILADILGLHQFDELEQKAKEHKRSAQAKLEVTQIQTEHLAQEIENRDEIAQAINKIEAQKTKIAKTISSLEIKQAKHQEERRQYELLIQQIKLARKRYREHNDQLKQAYKDKEITANELNTIKSTLKSADQIKASYQKYLKIQIKLEKHNHKLAQSAKLQEALSVLKHKKANLEQTINRVSKISNCPTCLRPMDSGEAAKVTAMLKTEFAKKDKPDLEKVSQEIKKIGYDEKMHQSLRQSATILQSIVVKYQELLVAENAQAEKQKQLEKLDNQIVSDRKKKQSIGENGKTLAKQAEKLQASYQKSQNIGDEIAKNHQQLTKLAGELGKLKQQLVQIKAAQDKLKKWRLDLKKLGEEAEVWAELAAAFSKKGIQTMIIEQTLPAIEEKANQLLERISDGKMKVEFVTQKAKKSPLRQESGGQAVIETLEIRISDEMGERDYELFSGGEAFRINFAIRVALAHLLALRSGAKLEFLVIDEGFGALDSAGRDDIIAAINSIRDDFKKIIVVSHVPELKDAFQTRIEITKDAGGSKINLLT